MGEPSVCSFGERKLQPIWVCTYTNMGSLLTEHNHPTRRAELSNCHFSMQGLSGLQWSLTTALDFSSPNPCCKVLSWAGKYSLEPVQSFCQLQQQPVLSALGRSWQETRAAVLSALLPVAMSGVSSKLGKMPLHLWI